MNSAKKHAIAAAMTTAAVLATLWVLRKAPIVSPITRPLVDKIISG